jgi:transposase
MPRTTFFFLQNTPSPTMVDPFAEDDTMRGDDPQQAAILSYISPEERVPQEHPLRAIRAMIDAVFKELSPQFEQLYSHTGRPSIAPEKLLRALLLQVLYTVRSERLLMEQLDYNLLFR